MEILLARRHRTNTFAEHVLEILETEEPSATALAERMAKLPTTQLVMLKLLCNQTVENMGFASSRTLGTLFDGIARHTQEGSDFV